MNLICFPMIPKSVASNRFDNLIMPYLDDLEKIREHNVFDSKSSEVNWLPVGTKIRMNLIEEFRSDVYKAIEKAFPNSLTIGTVDGHNLDILLIKIIGPKLASMGLTASMASTYDMWYYMNTVLFPDVVALRWRTVKQERCSINWDRYFAGARNYFGSLWNRFFFFYDRRNSDNPWWIIENLSEDDFVGILERTNSRGALDFTRERGRIIARMRMENRISRKYRNLDTVIREFNKRIRISTNCYDIAFLSKNPKSMEELMKREMAKAIESSS